MENYSGISGEDVLRYEESAMYEDKIRRLEESISTLRMSRRILMSLLEQNQARDQMELDRLREENASLKRRVRKYARQLLGSPQPTRSDEETPCE